MTMSCESVLYLPHLFAETTSPYLVTKTTRSPVTMNSLPIIVTTIHAGISPPSTPSKRVKQINVAATNSLSASGSMNVPNPVTPCRRAILPSKWSVAAANPKMSSAGSIWCARKQSINGGTRNSRKSVSRFANRNRVRKFISVCAVADSGSGCSRR